MSLTATKKVFSLTAYKNWLMKDMMQEQVDAKMLLGGWPTECDGLTAEEMSEMCYGASPTWMVEVEDEDQTLININKHIHNLAVKQLVIKIVKIGRKYYSNGGTIKLLDTKLKYLNELKELDPKVHAILDNGTIFYLGEDNNFPLKIDMKSIFRVIDMLCNTELEEL